MVGRLELRVDPSRPIYLQIVEQIQHGALRGSLAAGERLPSVRQLALDLGVNANTVARAYRDLEAARVIETRAGTGTFVSADAVDAERRRAMLAQAATVAWAKEMLALGIPSDEALRLARETVAETATKGELRDQ